MREDPYLKPQPQGNLVPGYVAIEPYTLGRHTYISEFTHIGQNTHIGNFCSIGNLCTIGAQKHPTQYLTSFPFDEILALSEPKATIIGSDVWIGCNSVVMMGVTVGHGAVIGAGAVVTKDVPPYAIVVGNPASLLRYRFPPDLIAGLLETRWWELVDERIKELPIAHPARCVALLTKNHS